MNARPVARVRGNLRYAQRGLAVSNINRPGGGAWRHVVISANFRRDMRCREWAKPSRMTARPLRESAPTEDVAWAPAAENFETFCSISIVRSL